MMSMSADESADTAPAAPVTARRVRRLPVEPRKHLVLFLSWLNTPAGDGLPAEFDRSGPIETLLDRVNRAGIKQWKWEMPLRAMLPHVSVLRTISLVPSTKSIEDVPAFASLVAGLAELTKVKLYVCCHPRQQSGGHRMIMWAAEGRVTGKGTREEVKATWSGVDFDEDFDAIFQCVQYVVHRLTTALGEHAGESDITIDITGGQKPPSIVGGAVSLNRDIHVQYVQTNEPKDAVSYDIVLTPSPHLHA